ncbi:hypothetical protein C2S51_038531 [Perilla frutescens var. frutescens]|nr:hypothetical protein C2S51_038531 [Perilla frutescens var. frutescens]
MGNHKLSIFSVENYDNWSRRMKAHLCSIHENMWEVIEDGPIIIMMDNGAHIVDINQPARIPKPTNLLTSEEKKLKNLEFVAQAALFQTLDEDPQDAAFYGERTRFRDARGRNNFRSRSSLTKENQGGSSTERKREATEKKENLTDDINDQIQSITKLLEKLKRARDKQSVSPQTDEVPKVEKTYQPAEWPAEPFRSGNRNLGECFHCHKQGHYRFECPELPEDKKAKVRRSFFKRKAMVANLENAVLDDSDYPSGIDSDGYNSDDEALFCLMADNDEEVSTADSQTSFYHINEATVSSNELDMKLMMLEDQLASISCLHVELKDENDELRNKVRKLSIDHERLNYLKSQLKEFEKLKLRTVDLEEENKKLKQEILEKEKVNLKFKRGSQTLYEILSHQRTGTGSSGLGYSTFTTLEKGKIVAQPSDKGILKGFTRSQDQPAESNKGKGILKNPQTQPKKFGQFYQSKTPRQLKPSSQSRPSVHLSQSTRPKPPVQQRPPVQYKMPSRQTDRSVHYKKKDQFRSQAYPAKKFNQNTYRRDQINHFEPYHHYNDYLDSINKPKRFIPINWKHKRHWPDRRAQKSQNNCVLVELFYPTNFQRRYHSTDSRRVERESKLMKRSKSVDSLNDKKPKVWQVWIPKDLMYQKGPDMKRDKSILSMKKTKDIWYRDSGCSKHMTGDREDLDGYEEIKGPLVTFGDNFKIRTIGEGFVVKGKVVVNGVSHVDRLKHKLLSISQLCDNGYSVDFTKNSCNIRGKSTRVILLTGIRKGNMYIVDWSTGYSEDCFLSKGSTEASWLWHRRLNHLNFKTINYLAKKELVEGLPKEIYKKTVSLEEGNETGTKPVENNLVNEDTNCAETADPTNEAGGRNDENAEPIDEQATDDVITEEPTGDSAEAMLPKWLRSHPTDKIVGDPRSRVQTRGSTEHALFTCFISQTEPANLGLLELASQDEDDELEEKKAKEPLQLKRETESKRRKTDQFAT